MAAQTFDPWGAVRSGGVSSTELNYTGQRKDAGTGLLFYNARYYDPALGRFLSADSIVPGTAAGSGGAAATLGYDERVALRPLTVDFHETGFVSTYNAELRFTAQHGFHFQLDEEARKHETYQWGPQNVQALNRYSYVLNNPLRYTDPSGHELGHIVDYQAGLVRGYKDGASNNNFLWKIAHGFKDGNVANRDNNAQEDLRDCVIDVC